MNYPDASKSPPEPLERSGIFGETDRLRASINRCCKAFAHLQEKMASAVVPSPPQAEGKNQQAEQCRGHSEISTIIRAMSHEVDSLHNAISEMASRVDL